MRVLILHNRYLGFGGEDVTVENEVGLLKDYGIDVSLLEFDNKNIGLRILGRKVIINPLNFIFNFNSYHEVLRCISNFKPEIIHVHNFWYLASPSIFYAARKMSIPVVVTIQNFRLSCIGGFFFRDGKLCESCKPKIFGWPGIKYRCFQRSYSKSFVLSLSIFVHKLFGTWKTVSKYLVLTKFHKERLLEMNLQISEDNIVIKENFTSPEIYTNDPERNNSFLYVGRLSAEKGMELLVNLIEQDLFYIEIIGSGPYSDKIKELENKYDKLKYHGFRDRKFILDRMRECKALLFLSKWYEGMPLTILESYSQGLPVICSDLPNLNEIVKNDITGKLFIPDSLTSLVETLNMMDDDKISSLSVQSIREFKIKYSSSHNFEKLISIYRSTINEFIKKSK